MTETRGNALSGGKAEVEAWVAISNFVTSEELICKPEKKVCNS